MSRPKNLEAIFGFTWKSKLCYWPTQWDLNLLNTPAPQPPPDNQDEIIVDERLAAALCGNGSEPSHH